MVQILLLQVCFQSSSRKLLMPDDLVHMFHQSLEFIINDKISNSNSIPQSKIDRLAVCQLNLVLVSLPIANSENYSQSLKKKKKKSSPT